MKKLDLIGIHFMSIEEYQLCQYQKQMRGNTFPQKKCDLLVIVSIEWTYLIDSSSDSADTDKKRRGRDNKSVEKSEEIISGWRLFVLFVSFSSRFHSLFNAED